MNQIKLFGALNFNFREMDILNKEALRVIEESPDWTPGKQRGKAVNVQFVFPINFVITSKKDKK